MMLHKLKLPIRALAIVMVMWSISACAGPDTARVVFVGNSICQFWSDKAPEFFIDNDFANRGVSGDTACDILRHFDRDVAASPQAQIVVILSPATNDIAQNDGPVTDDQIVRWIDEMVARTTAAGKTPILTLNLPVTTFAWIPRIDAPTGIMRINKRIEEYASERGVVLVDLFTPMAMPDGKLNPAYTPDGCHPNRDGYVVMQSVLLPVIEEQLKRYPSVR